MLVGWLVDECAKDLCKSVGAFNTVGLVASCNTVKESILCKSVVSFNTVGFVACCYGAQVSDTTMLIYDLKFVTKNNYFF